LTGSETVRFSGKTLFQGDSLVQLLTSFDLSAVNDMKTKKLLRDFGTLVRTKYFRNRKILFVLVSLKGLILMNLNREGCKCSMK
jgi:hypothetical protein